MRVCNCVMFKVFLLSVWWFTKPTLFAHKFKLMRKVYQSIIFTAFKLKKKINIFCSVYKTFFHKYLQDKICLCLFIRYYYAHHSMWHSTLADD